MRRGGEKNQRSSLCECNAELLRLALLQELGCSQLVRWTMRGIGRQVLHFTLKPLGQTPVDERSLGALSELWKSGKKTEADEQCKEERGRPCQANQEIDRDRQQFLKAHDDDDKDWAMKLWRLGGSLFFSVIRVLVRELINDQAFFDLLHRNPLELGV